MIKHITRGFAIRNILLVILPIYFGLVVSLASGVVFAADPGCYQKTGAVLGDKVQTSIVAVNCPPDEVEEVGSQCFLANVTVSSQGSSVGKYDPIDCSSISVGTTNEDCGESCRVASPSSTVQDSENFQATLSDNVECEGALLDRSCPIIDYLVKGINFLSAVAVMAIIASIMIAGFQYMTARDNSGQVEAARKRIIWAIIALVVYIFMYAILDYLVPGGVLPV